MTPIAVPKKILIVEDELAFLEILNTLLTKRGYQVTQATNGQDGLQMATDQNPDLILLDIRMPVMDGLTMLDHLRQTNIGKDSKVIILTNLEPDNSITNSVINNKPLYYFIKSDTPLSDLFVKIDELLSEPIPFTDTQD